MFRGSKVPGRTWTPLGDRPGTLELWSFGTLLFDSQYNLVKQNIPKIFLPILGYFRLILDFYARSNSVMHTPSLGKNLSQQISAVKIRKRDNGSKSFAVKDSLL
jgi:hypothetical protein